VWSQAGTGEAKRGRVASRALVWTLADRQSACFLRRVLVKCWWGFSAQLFAKPKAPFGFCQLAFEVCSLRRWVWPNPACSGHGYAVGQRWRFEGGVASPTMLLGKHAVPLTQSLGALVGKSEGAKPAWSGCAGGRSRGAAWFFSMGSAGDCSGRRMARRPRPPSVSRGYGRDALCSAARRLREQAFGTPQATSGCKGYGHSARYGLTVASRWSGALAGVPLPARPRGLRKGGLCC